MHQSKVNLDSRMAYDSNVKLVNLSNFAKMTTFPRHIGSRTQLRHVEKTIEASNYVLEEIKENLPQ